MCPRPSDAATHVYRGFSHINSWEDEVDTSACRSIAILRVGCNISDATEMCGLKTKVGAVCIFPAGAQPRSVRRESAVNEVQSKYQLHDGDVMACSVSKSSRNGCLNNEHLSKGKAAFASGEASSHT